MDCRLPIADCRMRFEGCTRPARHVPASIRHSAFGNRHSAYTLTEVLIVIAIIVLAIGLAVPAIRSLTGNKSQQAAQNVISAFLSRARAEAIGLQRRTGVLFFIDPATERVEMAEVWTVAAESYNGGGDLPNATYLDLVPDRDSVSLPPGVRLQVLKDNLAHGGGIDTGNLFRDARYLGFNRFSPPRLAVPTDPVKTMPIGGVILFSPSGRVEALNYGLRFASHSVANSGKPVATALGELAFQEAGNAKAVAESNGGPNWPSRSTPSNSLILRTAIGFVLYDKETGQNNGVTDDDSTSKQTEDQRSRWLDQNTTPVFINRYNGTLIRAE